MMMMYKKMQRRQPPQPERTFESFDSDGLGLTFDGDGGDRGGFEDY